MNCLAPTKCGANQVIVLEDDLCEQTCNNNILSITPPKACKSDKPGCDCAKGFYRNSLNLCVPASSCGQYFINTLCPIIIGKTVTLKNIL